MNTPSRSSVPLALAAAGVLGSCDVDHDVRDDDAAPMQAVESEADPCEGIEEICDGVRTAYEAFVLAQTVLELAKSSEEEPITLPSDPIESWFISRGGVLTFRAPQLCDTTPDYVPTGFTLYPEVHTVDSSLLSEPLEVEEPDFCLVFERPCGGNWGHDDFDRGDIYPPSSYDSFFDDRVQCFRDPGSDAWQHWEWVHGQRSYLDRQDTASMNRQIDRSRGR